MSYKRTRVLIAIAIVVVLIFSLASCVDSKDQQLSGVALTVKNWIDALNQRSVASVASTIYEVDSTDYADFVNQHDVDYFDNFSRSTYTTINLDWSKEISANAVYSKWTISLQISYTVPTASESGSTEISARDNFENTYYFAKRGENWYFSTEPDPFSGNVAGEGFTLDDANLPKYTLTFDSNGGTIVEPQTVSKGHSFLEPTQPTREGYAFAGWYIGNDLLTYYDFNKTPTESVKAFAGWSKPDGSSANSVVSINSNDSIKTTNINASSISISVKNTVSQFNLLESLSLSNKATASIYKDRNCTDKVVDELPLEYGNNTFFVVVLAENGTSAKIYTTIVKRLNLYKVSFKDKIDDESSLTSDLFIEENDFISSDLMPDSTTVKKTGYSLTGWQLNGIYFDNSTKAINQDIILTAVWGAQQNSISLDAKNGTSIITKQVVFNDSYNFGVPTLRGYTFICWENAERTAMTDNKGASIKNWDETLDQTFYARWQITNYNIWYRLVADGENNNPDEYNIKSNIVFNAPTRTGFNFDGWYLKIEDNVFSQPITAINASDRVGDIEIYAKWIAKNYTIVFNTMGANSLAPENQTVAYTSKVIKPQTPTKNGKTFVGWYTTNEYKELFDFDKTPTGEDLTINLFARWTEEYTNGLSFAKNSQNTYSVHKYNGNENENIIIPSKYLGIDVTAVDDSCFRDSKIISLTLPTSISKIGVNSFANCAELTTLNMPSVKDIAKSALTGCSSLKNLTLSKISATDLGHIGALFGTSSYNSSYNLTINNTTTYFVPIALTHVSLTNLDDKMLNPYMFSKAKSLTDISIVIGYLGDDFSIGHYAFYGCHNLKTLTFTNEDKIKTISSHAFDDCKTLTTLGAINGTINIPNSVITIGGFAFKNVTSPIKLGTSLTKIDEYSFADYDGTSISQTTAIISIMSNAFNGALNLKKFGSTPNSIDLTNVTYLEDSIFKNCFSIENVMLPTTSAIDSIPNYAFQNCRSLSAVSLPDNIKTIGVNAYEQANISALNLNKVTTVLASAFYFCTNLTTVTSAITSSQTLNIGAYSFGACNEILTDITMTNHGNLIKHSNWLD